MKRPARYMQLVLASTAALLVAACASMGRPQGGPRDEDPPVFVKSNPAPGSLNVDQDRITIEFDENVQIKDAMNKIVVSPTQKSMPKIQAVGRRVTVNLQDSLLPNTTYTIDFTDAISDLNEGNELDGFALDFSTGPTIDSLSISGMVFAAENLEPAQGMLVGVYSNLSDTAITTLPFDRITRTNQYGQFTIRNLKEGTYRIFAINDVNRDNHWDRSEDIAFYDSLITPTAAAVMRTDTLKAANGADSTVTYPATAFGPNDVLLTWFNENYKALYMAKYERKDRNRIYFEMGAPTDSLPRMTIVGGPFDGQDFSKLSVLEASKTLDTLTYWIADTTLMALDSLKIAVNYQRVDTLERIVWNTDTLNFNMRQQKKKKSEESENAVKKYSGKTAKTDSLEKSKIPLLNLRSNMQQQTDVFMPLTIESGQPIKSWLPEAMHLDIKDDTLWVEIDPPLFHRPDSLHPLSLTAEYEWEPGAKYRLRVDTLGVTDIYGLWNGNWEVEFGVRALEEYANLQFDVQNLDGRSAVVQLLNTSDKPVRTAEVSADGEAIFRHLMPGTYYARLFIDSNGNGKYDTGSVADTLQPEEVYYFPQKMNLKKNWDVKQTWDIYSLPVDLQKPEDIKKNKPKKKAGELDLPEEDDEQYYDEFGNPAVDPDDPFGKRKNQRYNNLNSRDNLLNNSSTGAGYRTR